MIYEGSTSIGRYVIIPCHNAQPRNRTIHIKLKITERGRSSFNWCSRSLWDHSGHNIRWGRSNVSSFGFNPVGENEFKGEQELNSIKYFTFKKNLTSVKPQVAHGCEKNHPPRAMAARTIDSKLPCKKEIQWVRGEKPSTHPRGYNSAAKWPRIRHNWRCGPPSQELKPKGASSRFPRDYTFTPRCANSTLKLTIGWGTRKNHLIVGFDGIMSIQCCLPQQTVRSRHIKGATMDELPEVSPSVPFPVKKLSSKFNIPFPLVLSNRTKLSNFPCFINCQS